MSALVVGLVVGLAVGAVVIFCCVKNIFKEKKAINRQVKQVQVEEDPCFDDVEAPTPPSERDMRREARAKPKSAPAPMAEAAPSYDDLQAPSTAAAAAAAAEPNNMHVYGDDSDDFAGRHDYQAPGDPYDAPVRVSRSTERRSSSGGGRRLSPEPASRSTTTAASSRGRSAVRGAEAAAAVRAS